MYEFSTRPFLEPIEKIWIIFQLLKGLDKCHSFGIFHGDIKSENILVTSWNWIYLSDFAPFKPVFIPENDPSQFSFYFDTSQRRSCYVAPERFTEDGEVPTAGNNNRRNADSPGTITGLTAEMDIFSLGCVIAELFLEGSHIFTLAQLFKYKKGEYTPNISGIENESVRKMVESMISRDPTKRLSAGEYLRKWRKSLFPDYFYNFLHDFVSKLSTPNSYDNMGKSVKTQKFLDNRLTTIYVNLPEIMKSLGFSSLLETDDSIKNGDNNPALSNGVPAIISPFLEIEGSRIMIKSNDSLMNVSRDDGALIILNVVLSTIRNVSSSGLKVRGCDLILAFSLMINDEAKLDRCLPYLLALLDDESEIVQVQAIRNMTQLLGLISVITPLNGEIFSEYIFPKLDMILRIHSRRSTIVRTMYASCFPTLSTIASRFLEMSQILKTSGVMDPFDPDTENGARHDVVPFDLNRQGLVDKFEEHTIALLSDEDTSVRKALLRGIFPLCLFFGKQKTNDVILSHILTYLNDTDSSLKRQFFDCIISLGPYIGPTGFEQYIQPLMLQALSDPEELVTAKTFETYTSFSELGLIKKPHIPELLKISVRYTVHPNPWVRLAAFDFISSSVKWVTLAEAHCLIYPILQPFLEDDITDFSQASLASYAIPPLSRPLFNSSISWVSKAQKSQFWKAAALSSGFFTSESISNLPAKFKDVSLSSEDQKWVQRLQEMGADDVDLWKITVLREHIYRLAGAISSTTQKVAVRDYYEGEKREQGSTSVSLIRVESFGIQPQVFVFPNEEYEWETRRSVDFSQGLPVLDDISSNKVARDDPLSEAISDSIAESGTSEEASLNDHIPTIPQIDIIMGENGARVEQSPATTGTVTTDVYGTVEQPFSHIPNNGHRHQLFSDYNSTNSAGRLVLSKRAAEYEKKHDLEPYVAKLLDSVHFSHYAAQPSYYGPQVVPVTHAEHLHNLIAPPHTKPNWKPVGVLGSQFVEHKSAINKIEISPDHSFFLTGSDDGTIKIWDCSRLEKNVINKSIQTYRPTIPLDDKKQPPSVKFLCFLEASHTFAASYSNGLIEFVRIDVSLTKNVSRVKFRRFVPVRRYNLALNEYATWMKHVKMSDSSLLIISTTKSRIIGLDVNTFKEKFIFKCPSSHGIPSCFVIDSKKCWLLLGTLQGVLDLFDLRFSVLVKTWTFKNASPIQRLFLRPKSKSLSICMLGGTGTCEASIWNITTMTCEEVYSAATTVDLSKSYYAINFEEDGKVETAERNTLKMLRGDTDARQRTPDLLCMAVGIDSPRPEGDGDHDKQRHIYMLSGGVDKKIRFWDINSTDCCSIVSGLNTSGTEPPSSGTPVFYQTYNNVAVKIVGEKYTHPDDETQTRSGRNVSKQHKPTRTNVISSEQQELAKNHQATITDIAMIYKPYQMVVSADRSGVIKVYI